MYITRAFWSSLVAVLSAAVLVAIILFTWQAWKNVILSKIIPSEKTMDEKTLSRLEELETLKGEEEVSMEDKSKMLDELTPEADTVSEAEKLQLLESLKQI